ncbi:MAG: GGDEF domain-containing protein [Coprobacillus sp.]
MEQIIRTIIYCNALPIVLLVIFLVLVRYNPLFNRRQSRLFTLAACTVLFMIFVVIFDYFFTYFRYQPFVSFRTITTFLNFAFSPLIPIFLDKISNQEKSKWYIYVPFFINTGLCLLSIVNGVIFSIGPTNGYGRGILFFVPFMTTLFYILVLFVRSSYRYLRSRFSERIFLMVTICLLIGSMVLEIVYYYLFFVWTTVAITLPLYYLLLNINQSIIDPLTRSYNRLMYNKDIERIDGKKKCIVALLDINNFKLVNDNYGHDFGDKYLINFVSLINHSLPSTSSIYRIGGDEFIIISKTSDLEKTANHLAFAKKEALKNDMDFSYGIDMYMPNQEFSEFIKHIDQLMYQNKKKDKEGK